MGSSLSIKRPRKNSSRITVSKIKEFKIHKPFHPTSLNDTYNIAHQPLVNGEKELCQTNDLNDGTCQYVAKNDNMECDVVEKRTMYTKEFDVKISTFQHHTSSPEIHSYSQNHDELQDYSSSLHKNNRQNKHISNAVPSRSLDKNISPQRNVVCKSHVKHSTPNRMIEISSDSSSDDAPLHRKHIPDKSVNNLKVLTDSIRNMSASSEHEDSSDDTSVYDWLSSCKINETQNSIISQNKHKTEILDCYSPVERDSKKQDRRTYLHLSKSSDNNGYRDDKKMGSSGKCQIDSETNKGHETPLRDNKSFFTHHSSKTMFTPPTPQCDSPLEKEVMKIRSYVTGMTVRDTKTVTRKKACLPKSKPDAKKGNWLTNRCVVNNYILLNQLGKGSYGEVRLCKDKASNRLFAIKIMNRDMLNKKTVCEEVIHHTSHSLLKYHCNNDLAFVVTI